MRFCLPPSPRHNFNYSELAMYEKDGLHPLGPGSHLYADMFISYFQGLAKRVRGEDWQYASRVLCRRAAYYSSLLWPTRLSTHCNIHNFTTTGS